MKARVESMGGTTLEMIIPSTVAISRPAGSKRLWRRMPHSSAVCSWTVRRRHCETSLRPSNAPMVMLLLPASSASSTYASCKDQGVGSVVSADHEVAFRVEAAGRAMDAAVGEIDRDAPAGGVGRRAREEAQNVVGRQRGVCAGGGEERVQQVLGIGLAAGDEFERGRFDAGREFGLIDVDADTGDGLAFLELDEDAGDLAVSDHDIVRPAEVARDGDGFGGGEPEREGEERGGFEDDRAVEAGARRGVPGVSVAALAGGLLAG